MHFHVNPIETWPTRPRLATALVALWLGAPFGGVVALAQGTSGERDGRAVYDTVCSACHAEGVANAPRFGDRTRWRHLLREPQWQLTAHAWVGVRGMPPRGGRDDLTLGEFSRAVAYMARAGGGRWQDPDGATLARIRREVTRREAVAHRPSAH